LAPADFNQLVEQFLKLNNTLAAIQKQPVNIAPGTQLSTSALHLIALIGQYPLTTVTELAQKAGLTKGAVSQQVAKLVQAELVQTTQVATNKKNKLLTLTAPGQAINRAHTQLHAPLYVSVQATLDSFSPAQQQALLQMIDQVTTSVIDYQHTLTKGDD